MTVRWILACGLLATGCSTQKAMREERSVSFQIDSASGADARKRLNNLPDADYEPGYYTTANKQTIPYRILKPARQASGKKYPLVITLHNSSRIGTDNQKQLEPLARIWLDRQIRHKYPAFVLAPQFPVRSANYTTDSAGTIVSAVPDTILLQIIPLIDSIKRQYSIDTNRVYVMGYSMGGSSALSLLAHTRNTFAAAVAIAPVTEMERVSALTKTPVWLIHGMEDTENPFTVSKRFFKAAGQAAPIRFWQIAGATHNTIVAPELLSGKIPAWLFKHTLQQ